MSTILTNTSLPQVGHAGSVQSMAAALHCLASSSCASARAALGPKDRSLA
jgi:hypothetical protein